MNAQTSNQLYVMLRPAALALALSGVFALSGCSDDGGQSAFVEDVRVDPATARVGQRIDVQVTFEPEQDDTIDGNGVTEDTELVIKLPPGVDYVDGTSELDNGGIDDFDDRSPNGIQLCNDGTRVITFDFDEDELRTGDNRIRIQARAYEVSGSGLAVFSAQAGEEISFPCAIFGDDEDSIVITND